MAIADAPNSGQPHHSPHMMLLLVLSSFPSEDHPSHSVHMLMVGLWLYRRLPAHCRNHHMAALLTAPLLDQVRQILRLPSRTLFGSPFPCFSDHDSNKIEFMGQSCKLRWKLQVFLISTSWRRLRQGRVCPRHQMSCCSLESNNTWIQVACLLLDWSNC